MADASATAEAVEHLHGRVDVGVLAQVEASPDRGRPHRRELVLERRPHGGAEAVRGLDDDVEQQAAGGQAQLGLLTVEVEHCLLHGAHGPSTDARPAVQHTVDRGLGQAGLLGDVTESV